MSYQNLIKEFHSKISSETGFQYIDVGAMGGLDKEWISFKDFIRIIGFEPDDREFRKLASTPTHKYFNFALFEKENTPITLHISKDPGKTSIYQPNMDLLNTYPSPERFHTVKSAVIPAEKVKTLDSVLQNQTNIDFDFLKLDTQGSELPILKGSQKTLKSILGIKIEVEFIELYKGQPLFSEVDKFLNEQGFLLTDIRRSYWKKSIYQAYPGKGQLIFGDALYLKPAKNLSFEKVMKYSIICLVHGYHDLAIEALEEGKKSDSQNQQTYQGLIAKIKDFDSALTIGKVFKSRKVSLASDIVKKNFGKSLQDFADSDAMLGNRRTY